MKKIILFILFIIFSLINLSMDCNPPTDTPTVNTTITGIVKDAETGKPLQNVKISSDPTSEEVFTNAEGRYLLRVNIQVGLDYRIVATLNAYLQNHVLITAIEGENRVGDIQLEPIKPKLDVTPTVLDFGTTQTSRIITIKNVGTGELSWSIKAPSESWLSLIGTLSGTIADHAQTVEVKVNRGNLSPGTYTSTIVVTSNGGNYSIEVSMGVPDPYAPRLYAYPANLDFVESLSQLKLYIKNIGTGQLEWNLIASDSWFQLSSTSGNATNEIDEITVNAFRNQLNEGSYTGTIIINSNGGNATINVSIKVAADPVLSYSPNQLDFGTVTNSLTFEIKNIGGGTLNWSLYANRALIQLDPISGENDKAINVSIDRTNQSEGTHNGTISITSNGGNGSVQISMEVPVQIPVLTVHNDTLDFEKSTDQMILRISNSGFGILNWSLSASVSWINANPSSGQLAAGQSQDIIVSITRSNLLIGENFGTINITASDGGNESVIVKVDNSFSFSDLSFEHCLTIDFDDAVPNIQPTFADLDNDGDFDLILGIHERPYIGYENAGTLNDFDFIIEPNNFNLDKIEFSGDHFSPNLVDLDGDGDYDLILGACFSTTYAYRNIGSKSYPDWIEDKTLINGILQVGEYTYPATGDLDGNGTIDLLLGEQENARINGFLNIGTKFVPNWSPSSRLVNAIGIQEGEFGAPALGDLDFDGDLDLILCYRSVCFVLPNFTYTIYTIFYENIGNSSSPQWLKHEELSFELNGNVYHSTPALIDIDSDGDLDLFLGIQDHPLGRGKLLFYKNISR